MDQILDITHELLYDHDCVIIPGLGGFITQAKGASWDPENRELLPKRKTLAFNSRLDQNDGILANALQQQSAFTYEQALDQIEQWSSSIKLAINEKGHIQLKGLGTLYAAAQGQQVFVPEKESNFDRNSYGLYSIKLREKTKSLSKSLQTKRAVSRQEQIAEKKIAETSNSPKINLNLINVLGSVFILAMVFSLLNMELGPNKNLPYLSQYLDTAMEWPEKSVSSGSGLESLFAQEEIALSHSILLNGTFSSLEVEKIVADLDQLYIQNEIIELGNKKYQIAVISFMDKELAIKYRNLLQKKIPYELIITAK